MPPPPIFERNEALLRICPVGIAAKTRTAHAQAHNPSQNISRSMRPKRSNLKAPGVRFRAVLQVQDKVEGQHRRRRPKRRTPHPAHRAQSVQQHSTLANRPPGRQLPAPSKCGQASGTHHPPGSHKQLTRACRTTQSHEQQPPVLPADRNPLAALPRGLASVSAQRPKDKRHKPRCGGCPICKTHSKHLAGLA